MSTLLEEVTDATTISAAPFDILKRIAAAVSTANVNGEQEVEVQKLVLYALEHRKDFGPYADVIEGFLRARGLYPYMREESLSPVERLAFEAHKPSGLDEIVLHQKQAEVYVRLLAGQNVVLSAPTSFGKSLLIDAMIASKKYRNVAVIVPTIALIDETRRRLAIRFGDDFKIITHASQSREDKNIFVMTQERVLDFEELPALDFFVIDEFYKLDPRRDADRSFLLNQALYRLLRTGAQFYMLGPNIQRIPEAFDRTLKSTFISTPFATVVTEQVAIASDKTDALKKLVSLCQDLKESTLIYCASPASARRVANALIAVSDRSEQQDVMECASWIGENYHPLWVVARSLSHGIGVHHGKVPRALSQFAVRAFNQGHLKYLVCTSTLIEGVNTKAKNVVVFDNRVANQKFDFFTFNNIRGRSGRMFHHFVGRVFLFNPPPQDDLPSIDVPLVNQGEGTPDSFLIHLDDDFLSGDARERMRPLQVSPYLSLAVMRSNSGIDPQAQIDLARQLTENPNDLAMLSWRGFPDYDHLKFVCELMFRFFVKTRKRVSGVSNGSQLAFLIHRLSKARTIKNLILKELAEQEDPDADKAVEDVLDFTRTWAAFHFPRYLMAIDRIQRDVAVRLRTGVRQPGDFSAYAAGVENLFTSPGLVALDEYGVPLQIAERISGALANSDTVDAAIEGLRALRLDRVGGLSPFERQLLADAKASLGKRPRVRT